MKSTILALATATIMGSTLVSTGALAQTTVPNGGTHQNRMDMRNGGTDMGQDRRDINQDKRQLRQDTRSGNTAGAPSMQNDINSDQQDLSKDRQDMPSYKHHRHHHIRDFSR